jgi:hypothetical protein
VCFDTSHIPDSGSKAPTVESGGGEGMGRIRESVRGNAAEVGGQEGGLGVFSLPLTCFISSSIFLISGVSLAFTIASTSLITLFPK